MAKQGPIVPLVLILGLLLIPIAIGAAFLFLETLVYWPVGSVPENIANDFKFLGLLLGLPLIIAYHLAWIILPVCLLFSALMLTRALRTKKSRTVPVILLALGLLCSEMPLVGAGAFWSFEKIFHSVYTRTANRAAPLVNAIEQYHRSEGVYPASLQDMVPDLLPEVPHTGLAGHPKFLYQLAPGAEENSDSFSLSIKTPKGVGNWDVFYYSPEESTSTVPTHEPTERFGDWLYLHE